MQGILQPDDKIERCGLVMSDGSFVELENVAQDPVTSFEMAPEAVIPLIESGHVVSTWHTHPGGPANLSGDDRLCFLAWPDLTHIIIGPDGHKEYEVKDGVVVTCK